MFAAARKTASDANAAELDRVAAIHLLGGRWGHGDRDADAAALGALAGPQNAGAIQTAALANLGRMRGGHVGEILVGVWKDGSPAVRMKVMDELLSRREWTETLLDAS